MGLSSFLGIPDAPDHPEAEGVFYSGDVMSPYEIIAAKRDGKALTDEQINYFIQAFMAGEAADYQTTALLMAIYLNGMNDRETASLTRAYINSGDVIDLSDIAGIKVDKHSTGGVGDKVSIVLAPLAASLGVPVPMISGRGLGHSGGTLDKLESIPGFNTQLSVAEFKSLVDRYGLGLIGQTADIVPADKRIYALRDVTATVDCIPLICASIMSKKIAEGIDALVLDVKYGNGAFMKDPQSAQTLAEKLIQIGKSFGKEMIALITSMEQPLGNAVGNWLEIEECLDCFHGRGPEDLMEVTYTLAAHMLVLGGRADSLEQARQKAEGAIQSGKAWNKFLEICAAQGGDVSYLKEPERYGQSKHRAVLKAGRAGIVQTMNTFEIGMTAVQLGAGRLRAEDVIDPRAGIRIFKKIGQAVEAGEPLLEIRTNKPELIDAARQRLQAAIVLADKPAQAPPLILKTLR